MAKSLVHLNGNILCVIDTETTGLVAGVHDVIQVCVLPLDSNLEPLKEIEGKPLLPFVQYLKPKHPETADKDAIRVNKLDLDWLINNGMEPYYAADLFDEWFQRLKLPIGKKIAPVGANVPFDRAFIIDWLGNESYNNYFDYHIRDIQAVANFINDRSAFQGEKAPYPKVNVSYLASILHIEHSRAHDALQDCLVEAKIYKQMVVRHFGIN